MSNIVKNCKFHGDLKQDQVYEGGRCAQCSRDYAKKWRDKNPEKVKLNNKIRNDLIKEYKSHGYEFKPIKKNNKYYPGRTSVDCKKHGNVTGEQLITRENGYLRCRLCAYERNRSWEKRNKDKVKAQKRRTYLSHISQYQEDSILRQKKITKEEYYLLLEKQGDNCEICGKKETNVRGDGTRSTLSIDHCHKTGKVRALLCRKCNTLIGLAYEDPIILERAAVFVRAHNANSEG